MRKTTLFTTIILLALAGFAFAQWANYYDYVSSVADGDQILIQDVSDTTDTAQGTTAYTTAEDIIDSQLPDALGGDTAIDDIMLTDGTDTHTIKAVQETGLGGRLTIGLDETARTMVIADYGDIDTDLGLSAESFPSFKIFDTDADSNLYIGWYVDDIAWIQARGAATYVIIDQPLLLDGDVFAFGSAPDFTMQWDPNGANDDFFSMRSPESDSNNIPVINISDISYNPDGDSTNDDLTEPGIRIWDDDADSWVLITFATDDNPQISVGGSANPLTISNQQVVEEVFIPIAYGIDSGSNPPSSLNTLVSTNGYVDVRDFDGTAQDEDVMFVWSAPSDLDATTGIKFRVICYVSAATGPSAETWQFEVQGFSLGDGDALAGTLGTAQTSNSGSRTDVQYDRVSTAWSSAMTSTHITDLTAGETVHLKLYRDIDDTDDYGQDIAVAGIELRYKRNMTTTF